jgi:single-strand DNA-binding protein
MFNHVALIGNLTRNPEFKTLESGTAVAKFSVANNRVIGKDSDGTPREEVMFIDVTVFGKGAELAHQYLTKGRRILVSGRLKQDRWVGNDGTNHSRHVIITDTIDYLDAPKTAEAKETKPDESEAADETETTETCEEGDRQ